MREVISFAQHDRALRFSSKKAFFWIAKIGILLIFSTVVAKIAGNIYAVSNKRNFDELGVRSFA